MAPTVLDVLYVSFIRVTFPREVLFEQEWPAEFRMFSFNYTPSRRACYMLSCCEVLNWFEYKVEVQVLIL